MSEDGHDLLGLRDGDVPAAALVAGKPEMERGSAEKATGWWAVVVMTARTVPRRLSDRVPGW
ncbi:hypothetical protein [Actinomadura sp. 3N407]|uniref:hypothetical protein n=1 Tax=Actinomadura sp. 3N407 TaxID=3457423 RepID=UPI003FCE4C34